LKELRVIRERGYGLDEEERERGVCCIAAPICNHTGDIVAAISVAGPIDRMPAKLAASEMAGAVVAVARAISIDLGAADKLASVESGHAARAAHGGRK